MGKKYWRVNYGQKVSLGGGCNHKGTIMHEIMHAIGFWHEQSRPDRNQYVEVLWENILDGEYILSLFRAIRGEEGRWEPGSQLTEWELYTEWEKRVRKTEFPKRQGRGKLGKKMQLK